MGVVTVDDETLLDRARSGDVTAFEALAEHHYPGCLRFARRYLGHREDAEEAVQEALIRAYRAVLRGRAPERFRPWLLGIVLNRCRTLIARRSRRRLLFRRWAAQETPAQDAAVPGAFDGDDLDPALERALAGLSPGLREAFLLKHVEELTYEEMAEIMGAGVSALKMRVKRAAELLAGALEDPR